MNVQSNSGAAAPDWRGLAAAVRFRCQPFIGGRFVPSAGDECFETINPATGEALCALPAGTIADVDAAVAAAQDTYRTTNWASGAPGERKQVLQNLAMLVEAHGDELALLDSLEMGKAVRNARAEIALSTSMLRYFAEAVDKLTGDALRGDARSLGFKLFEPRGVVGAIVPWNFPLANAVTKIAPALAAGNCLVLKPSELASLSALRLAELAAEAGLPAGVLNVVPGLGATVGEAIGRHDGIDFVSFTGSTATGRRVMTYAGESNGKPVMLELGGKSAQIVCADMADELGAVAAQVAHDAFWNQGQWCAARSRLIVEDSLHDRLLEAVSEAASRLVPGDPLDPMTNYGTIASTGQFDRVRRLVDSGIAAGARLAGGSSGAPCELAMAPGIFYDVAPDMAIVREEIFGPVLCVQRFRSFEEAIDLANASEYGLAATVWTHDLSKAWMAARAIRAGKVQLRSSAAPASGAGLSLAGEPWGASGFGAEKGLDGLRSYCRAKAVEVIS